MNGLDIAQVVTRLGVAALGGLAVGIEREWSMKRGKHEPHFAGIRTFLLLGLLGALGALLSQMGYVAAGGALLVGAAALIVVSYALTSRRGEDVGGTTEVASLVVLAGSTLAGLGHLALASGLFAMTTLVLVEKSALHQFVTRIESHELMAAVRFGVLALVIFPLLPEGPFGPGPGFRPRELWMLVLAFSGLSFMSFVALRLVGSGRGYGLVGLLGGLVSSTAVTLNFSRESRQQPSLGWVLGLGVVAACAVLPLRVLLLLAALNLEVARHALPYLVPPFGVGLLIAVLAMRRREPKTVKAETPRNPLRFAVALQMALAFQVVLYIVDWAHSRFGASGTLTSAGLIGLTDVDALIYSMVKLGDGAIFSVVAAKALAIGVISNTAFKLVVALTLGRGEFKKLVGVGLLALAAASLAPLVLL